MHDINKSSLAELTTDKYNHDVTVIRRARPSRVALSDNSASGTSYPPVYLLVYLLVLLSNRWLGCTDWLKKHLTFGYSVPVLSSEFTCSQVRRARVKG